MYIYCLSQGNPEGTDYSLILQHEKKFTNEEFQDIAEASIMEAINKEIDVRGSAFISSVDTRELLEILSNKGFQSLIIDGNYYLEPYWDRDNVKNKDLLTFINKKK